MKQKTTKIISLLAAGKLALSVNHASAEGLGKVDSNTSSNTSLSLDQIGYPLQILTPPNTSDSGSKSSEGIFFLADNGKALDSGIQPRIDFVINRIQQHTPVVVFLAYSTVQGSPEQWQDMPLNDFFLDRATTHIVSAIQVDPLQNFDTFNVTPSPLGNIDNERGSSVVVSLNLTDLNHMEFDSDNIYFQAVSIPLVDGQLVFSEAMISELDHYTISRAIAGQDGSGSKVTDSHSKFSDVSVGGSTLSDTSKTGGGSSDSGSKDSGGGDTGGK